MNTVKLTSKSITLTTIKGVVSTNFSRRELECHSLHGKSTIVVIFVKTLTAFMDSAVCGDDVGSYIILVPVQLVCNSFGNLITVLECLPTHKSKECMKSKGYEMIARRTSSLTCQPQEQSLRQTFDQGKTLHLQIELPPCREKPEQGCPCHTQIVCHQLVILYM